MVCTAWVGRLGGWNGFGEEAETGWRLHEFVVIPNTELKVSRCLLEPAGNQRADREQQKGQRTRSIEKKCSEKASRWVRSIKDIKKGNGESEPAMSAPWGAGHLCCVLIKQHPKSATVLMGGTLSAILFDTQPNGRETNESEATCCTVDLFYKTYTSLPPNNTLNLTGKHTQTE